MYNFKKSASTKQPNAIDKTSSSIGVYYRKNIEQVELENERVLFQYDEILLPYGSLGIDFSIEDETTLINNIETAITEFNQNETKQNRIKEIKDLLTELDLKTIRPLRAGETERVEELENQAVVLRAELWDLEK